MNHMTYTTPGRRIVLFVLLLGLDVLPRAFGNGYADLLLSISTCLTDSTLTAEETLVCLASHTECFDAALVESVKTCIDTNQGQGALEDCLGLYKTCVEGEIGDILASLPSCVNTTIHDLGMCYVDNAQACNSTCSLDDIPDSNPYAGLQVADVILCNGMQDNIVDPTCDIVDCCPQCIEQFESFMNCIVGDVLQMGVGPNTCKVSCEERRYLAGHLDDGTEPPPSNDIAKNCAIYLKEPDGMAAGDRPDFVRARLIEGMFMECIVSEAFLLAEAMADYNAPNPTSAPTTAPASGAFATSNASILMALLGFLIMKI